MAVPISSSKQTLCECVVFVYHRLCLAPYNDTLRYNYTPAYSTDTTHSVRAHFIASSFTHTGGTSVLLRIRQIDKATGNIRERFKILFKGISESRPQCGYCAGVDRDTNLIPLLVPRACKKYGIGGHPTHNCKIPSEMEAYLIFVIFFTRAKFLENKIYTEKTRKLRQNTQ